MTDVDPLTPRNFLRLFWPHVRLYREQWAIVDSVEENPETFVSAGNMLGKDFVSAYIGLRNFIIHPVCRIVTTSVKDDHLNVLWGEIGRFVDTCRYPLKAKQGGPLIVNHHAIKKVKGGVIDPISYLVGMVSERAEGLAGHHAPYTLAILDEASGIADIAYTQICTWAKRVLAIGNPNPTRNWFYQGIKGGDVIDDS